MFQCASDQSLTLGIVVPIFNIDQHPFALLCAYNTTAVSKNFVSDLAHESVADLTIV